KENEYAKVWNDWYKRCEECKFDKISYDKAYNDMQQKIERLQAQLGYLKGKSKDTSCVSDTLNPLNKKLEKEKVELEFQVLNYGKEYAHLKTTYKNLFDSISVTRTQTKTIIDYLQNKLHDTIYENAKPRAQLFDKVSDQKDTISGKSANTKFAKQSILGQLPKVGETHALSKPVTSNLIPTSPETKVVKNDKVIAPGMFRINPFKTSREEKHVPNKVRASVKIKPITVSQPPVITKKVVIQICLWCVDSGCSKHMTGNLKLLINFVWKFLGTVRFGNDHVAAILGFDDLQWGNILITRVYFVEGLGHNLFSVGQFCDSNSEVAIRRNACFVRNLEGVDLLKRDRSTNLYTINLHEMASASLICLMARASSTKLKDEAPEKTGYLLSSCIRGSLYPKNDREDIGKLGAKGDIGFFIGYSANSCAYRVFNRRTKKIMETINVLFDELLAMAFEQRNSKPRLQSMTSGQISSGLALTYAPSTIKTQQPTEGKLDLLFEAMYDDYIGGQPSSAPRTVLDAQAHPVRQTLMTSTSIADTPLTPTNSSS
nr:integrase, catalytic region, zinc finger, CCHC-type, peptidase aspartic, catalytic [Tanacetum cinerariifolium]